MADDARRELEELEKEEKDAEEAEVEGAAVVIESGARQARARARGRAARRARSSAREEEARALEAALESRKRELGAREEQRLHFKLQKRENDRLRALALEKSGGCSARTRRCPKTRRSRRRSRT